MNRVKAKSFLPSDETIYERSKAWSEFLSRIVDMENFEEMYYDELPTGTDTEDDDNKDDEAVESDVQEVENLNDNNRGSENKLSLAVKKFEASSDDDDYDVNKLLSETLPVVEERKRRWKESGMDRVLDSFDLNAITKKVGTWLTKMRLENSFNGDLSIRDAEIMHIEGHQFHLSSDDSLQSADTAKYILSNRKPRAASCTRMTIKRFRYVKGRQKELERKYNYLDHADMGKDFGGIFQQRGPRSFQPLAPQTQLRAIADVPNVSRFRSFSSPLRNGTWHNNFIEAPRQKTTSRPQRSRYSKRRPPKSRKRSVSSSSSASEAGKSEIRSKFRKVGLKTNLGRPFISGYNPGTSSDSECSSRKPYARQCRRPVSHKNPQASSDCDRSQVKPTATPRLRMLVAPRQLMQRCDPQSTSDCRSTPMNTAKSSHPVEEEDTFVELSSSSECEKKSSGSTKIKVKIKRMSINKIAVPNSNASGFLSDNLVNSTALSNTKPITNTKVCALSPIAEKSAVEISPSPLKKKRTPMVRRSQESQGKMSDKEKEKSLSSDPTPTSEGRKSHNRTSSKKEKKTPPRRSMPRRATRRKSDECISKKEDEESLYSNGPTPTSKGRKSHKGTSSKKEKKTPPRRSMPRRATCRKSDECISKKEEEESLPRSSTPTSRGVTSHESTSSKERSLSRSSTPSFKRRTSHDSTSSKERSLSRSSTPSSKGRKSYESTSNNENEKSLSTNSTQEIVMSCDKKILVYNPENMNLYGDSVKNGSFMLTEDHLRKAIGKRAAQRFIKFNVRKFPWKFDSTSRVYFKLPTESDHSHRSTESNADSDEDILNMFGKQGELVEEQQNTD